MEDILGKTLDEWEEIKDDYFAFCDDYVSETTEILMMAMDRLDEKREEQQNAKNRQGIIQVYPQV